jgi:hypothetical protein
VGIFFHWDPEARLVKGEKFYTDSDVWSQAAFR